MENKAFKRVAVFGDSLAKGVVYDPERKRYAFLKTTAASVAAEKLGVAIDNRSRFGFTAPRGMELMESALSSGLDAEAAVVEFGGNDCNFDWAAISDNPDAEHAPATPPETFYRTICGMVQLLIDAKIKPILTTLPPIDAQRYFHFLVGEKLNAANVMKWLGDTQQIYRFQELYSGLVQRAAAKMRCTLIDVRTSLLCNHRMRELICADGLHLTSEGQIIVGDTIAGLIRREE